MVLALSAGLFAVFLIISGFLFLRQTPLQGSALPPSSFFSGGVVGVLEISGVILDSKKALKQIDQFEESQEVKAVVIRLNSPGGAVAPSQEIYEAIRSLAKKKPVFASMSSVAASGAYYIACAARKIFANPGTITGSIGVIMEFANLKGLYDWARVQRYSIKTGKYKDAGAEYREMSADERALLQSMVDDVLSQFKQAVMTGRHLTTTQLAPLADGRIFSGSQAKTVRLVDELGTLQDAIQAAAQAAQLKGKPNVVYPQKSKRRWLEMLADETSRGEDGDSSESGLERIFGFLTSRLTGTSISPPRSPGIYWLWNGAR